MKSIGLKLATFRKNAHLSQLEVAELLTAKGLTTKNKSVSSWEKGIAIPNAIQLLALCEIYGITDIYSNFIGTNPSNPMNGLNEAGIGKATEYIELLKESPRYRSSETPNSEELVAQVSTPTTIDTNVITFPTRSLPVYQLPASAGTGEFLDNDYYEMTEVTADVSNAATFGIRIHGDSMQPRFTDGQIVWVAETQDLRNGDIGIFYLDGDAYCKKLYRNGSTLQLISLNKAYAPINVSADSDFRIYGKVVN